MKRIKLLITTSKARELFRYDEWTGILRWRHPGLGRRKDCIAGYLRQDGYLDVGFNGKVYIVHRVIFLMMAGRWPEEIDHENHIRSDNRWKNLKEVSRQQNCKNVKLPNTNTSGYMGIAWEVSTKQWKVRIKADGKQKYLGRFTDLEDAKDVRKKAEIKYGFHPNHGIPINIILPIKSYTVPMHHPA